MKLVTPDEARKALEIVIRSHSFNAHTLHTILDAWGEIEPGARMQLGRDFPALASALAKADASRPTR